jgi:transcription antitermination factor NusG
MNEYVLYYRHNKEGTAITVEAKDEAEAHKKFEAHAKKAGMKKYLVHFVVPKEVWLGVNKTPIENDWVEDEFARL